MTAKPTDWIDLARWTLEHYDAALLRLVAGRLVKPRNQWPAADLVERSIDALANAAVVDRRLQSLAPEGRQLLALIGHSRQPRWRLSSLLELRVLLGQPADLTPIIDLLEAGLLFPDLLDGVGRIKGFEQWVGMCVFQGLTVFAPPAITARVAGEDLGLPPCPGATQATGAVHETDGLEWPLRLSVVWQQVACTPLRRTQQGEFFKRDLDRLRTDPLLNAPAADGISDIPDAGLLGVELALAEGVLREEAGELTAGTFPVAWEQGLPATIESLWAALLRLQNWNIPEAWRDSPGRGSPYPAIYLLSLLLLSRLPEGSWADPAALEAWIVAHHPSWGQRPARAPRPAPESRSSYVVALAYSLRLVQAAKTSADVWVVRLSPIGRRVLGLDGDLPSPPVYPGTLTVQPNLEIVAFRQGLTPALVARLSRLASWTSLGAACTLQLHPETVYRALESGLTFEAILQTLDQHSLRPMPPSVVESVRTWANKRERLGVYPSATLFEFNRPEDLNEALARGLPAQRLSDRLAIVADESAIDYRQFRLAGTRDYALPPERCVEVEGDGVTLTVDLARSDLMLETELGRFADRIETAAEGRRQYRLSPASLARGRHGGMTMRSWEEWFVQRTGRGLTPAARLLVTSSLVPPLTLRRQLVIHVSALEVADGLLQWPATRALIGSRLGPTTLAITEQNLPPLREQLRVLGLTLIEPAVPPMAQPEQ